MILFHFNPWSSNLCSISESILIQFENENSIFIFCQFACWNWLQPGCWTPSSWTQFPSWIYRKGCTWYHLASDWNYDQDLTPLSGYQFLLSKKMQNQNRARVEYRKRLKDRAMASLAKNQKLQDDLGSE